MTDRVFVRHPDQPERNGYVSQAAFDALWSKKGYEIVDGPAATPSEADLNAALDRRAGLEPSAEVVVVPPDEETPEAETARLTALLENAGITVDGRWRLKRLRTEAANLTEVD